jgi:anti-sigma B factor antagonist
MIGVRTGRAMHGRDDFRIRRERLDDGVVLEVSGRLDICSSHTLREKLALAAVSGASRLVVDLSELRFIDSTGIGVLAMAARRLALEAGLAIVCPEGRVCRTLALAGLDRVAPIYTTRSEALCSKEAP